MAIDPVAWFIGNPGAQHSAELARLVAYAATGGNAGVVGAGDARVSALATPGSGVRVAAGAIAVPYGVAQTYLARVVSSETVSIAATGSAGGRTDLIAAVISDPSIPGGGTAPADPVNGPYWSVEVISGVPAGTTRLQDVSGHANTTGYALARVTLPANTGTVTNSHITDIRQLVAARKDRTLRVVDSASKVLNTSAYTHVLPTPYPSFDVPAWATHANLVVTATLAQQAGNTNGWWRLGLGSQSQSGRWNLPDAPDKSFSPLVAAGAFQVPSAMRGTSQQITLELNRSSGPGWVQTLADGQFVVDVEFIERA